MLICAPNIKQKKKMKERKLSGSSICTELNYCCGIIHFALETDLCVYKGQWGH